MIISPALKDDFSSACAGAAAGWNFASGVAIEDHRGRTVIDRDADDSFFASFTLRWAF
jgi:hypothetical protein